MFWAEEVNLRGQQLLETFARAGTIALEGQGGGKTLEGGKSVGMFRAEDTNLCG